MNSCYSRIFLFLCIFLSKTSEGNFDKLRHSLSLKSYPDFIKSFENINPVKYREPFTLNRFVRDIVANYSECIYRGEFVDEDRVCHLFKVELLVHKNKIIYYKFNDHISIIDSLWEFNPYKVEKDSFYNKNEMNRLKDKFTKNFRAVLVEEDLFNPVTFGNGCGYSGEKSEERQDIDKLVEKSNKAGLKKYLQSTIAEKQLYGIDGFYQLRSKNVQIDKDILDLIKKIKKKTGDVSICDGCNYEIVDMKTISKKYKFTRS